MEGFVAHQLHEFETGKLSRRALIETLTLAATTLYATSAKAQADTTLKAQLVNHISYTCPDYRPAADWYSKVFNLDQIGASGRDVAMPTGKKGEQPYGVTADDVPLTHIICRTRPLAGGGGGASRRKATALIDHLAFTVADFDRERAKAQLAAVGVTNVRGGGPFSVYVNDPFGYEIQIAGLGVTAICGAESRATCSDKR